MGVRGDLCLLETAVRRRFAIDREKAAQEVNKLMDSSDPRIRVRALSIAVMMESQNQKDEHKVIDVRVQTRNDELLGIATDLGIEVSVIEDAARQTDSGTGSTESQGDDSMGRRDK